MQDKIFLTVRCLSWSCLKAKFSAKLFNYFDKAIPWQNLPLSPLTDHLIDDLVMSQEKLIDTAKLQNFQLQGDRHPSIQTCTEDWCAQSTAVEFHLLQNKIFSPRPIQSWRQWHPEQKSPWVEISLNFTCYAVPAMPAVFHLLVTDCSQHIPRTCHCCTARTD